jgi:hypothetical protein
MTVASGPPHGWIVTRDFLESRPVSIIGPGGVSPCVAAQLRAGAGERFKLFDSDGVLYFSGRAIHDGSCGTQFAPLDDFGAPHSGCTAVAYEGNGYRPL